MGINIASNTSEALVPSGSTVSTVGNVAFNAQDMVTETSTAAPISGYGGGSGRSGGVGIGAGVALTISNNTTLAELANTAQLTGAHNLTFTAGSTDLVTTSAASGSAAAGSSGAVSITPTAAISVVNNTTQAQVGTPDAHNDLLIVGGAVSATATHTDLTMTAAGAVSGGGSTASLGITLALAFVTDKTTSTTGRSLDAQGGWATFEADGSAASLVSSNASASGGGSSDSQGSSGSGSSGSGSSGSVDNQDGMQRSYADNESGTLTDSKGDSADAGDTSKDAATPSASTSDGSVTVAAAVAVNIVDSEASATIPSGLTITTDGPLTVTATNDTGYMDGNNPNFSNPVFNPIQGSPGDSANAWGTAGGTSTVGVGAAVALNLVKNSTEATIGASTINSQQATFTGTLKSGSASVTGLSSTQGLVVGETVSDPDNDIPAGTTIVSIDSPTSMTLSAPATGSATETLTGSAAVNVNAGMMNPDPTNTPVNFFVATAASGAAASDVGVAGSLAINIVDNTSQALIETGASINPDGGDVNVTALNNANDQATSYPQNTGGNGTGGSVGIGAALALSIASDTTQAEIENGATVTSAGNVTVTANSSQNISTWGQNGAEGSTGVSGGIAIALASNNTTALIGSDPQTLTASGAVTINANASFVVSSLADATTTGADVGIGASVTVNTTINTVLAELDRNVTAGGAVSVTDTATASSQAVATASVEGGSSSGSNSSSGSDSSSGSNGTADQETQNQSSFAHKEGSSDPDVSAATDVPAPPTANSEMSSPSSESGSKSGGEGGATSVGVAGAVSVNVLLTSTVAEIENGLTITAGGALAVGTTNQSGAMALADARDVGTFNPPSKQTQDKDSIGAAVSLNVAIVTNSATIGTSDVINAAGVSVTALMPAPVNNTPQVNDFSTQGLGAADGSQVGVAGSAGINVLTFNTQASIGAGTIVISSAGLSVQAQNDETLQNISFTVAVGKNVGAARPSVSMS